MFHPGCAINGGFGTETSEDGKILYYCPKHKPISDMDAPCEYCNSNVDEGSMLICDDCGKSSHMRCLNPPLTEVPESYWFCDKCVRRKLILGTIIQVPKLSPHRATAIRSEYVPITKEYVASLPLPRALMSDESDEEESDYSHSEDEEEDEEGNKKKGYAISRRPSSSYKSKKGEVTSNKTLNDISLPNNTLLESTLKKIPPKHVPQRLQVKKIT